MADKEANLGPETPDAGKEQRYILDATIADDQRQYIESVREWLRDSLQNQDRMMMGGCI
jgi:hypothetical protein